MNLLQRLLPGSLVGRVFSLYVASLLLFVGAGLGLFYRYQFAQYALALSLGALVGGVVLIRISLKRWLGNFDRIRIREADILSGAIDVSALLDSDAPEEIRHTFAILSHAASRLSAQREEAAVTLNAISDGVITTDAQNRVVYCNPAAQYMLGIDGQAVIGQDVRTLLPSAFVDRAAPVAWKGRRLEVTGLGGNKTILDTTMSTIRAGDEGLVGQVLVFRDVTQQHALDNQKFALDQHAIVSITNLQGDITYANDRFCEISGYTRAELIGVNHRVVNSGHHGPELFTQMWQTLAQGQVWHGEICNRNKQGGHYWVSATIVPLKGVDGLPEQYIAIRTDITARKNFEAQLAEQLGFVEVLLEATPTAIYLKDLQGRYLRFNKAFEQLFGIERSDWMGKNVFDLVPGDAAAMMHSKDQELFDNPLIQTYESTLTNRKTGAVRQGLYWKAPLTNAQGQVTALVGTILDITERNRFEQDLRVAKQSAEAANKAKSDFLANMSHEIRTPMNGVIGMTDLALDTALNATQREYLSTVKSSAQSLMVILNDILDFSKIEAGKLNIEAVEFSLPDTIAETLKSIHARAEKKGLVLACRLAPDLPERVIGDPGRLRQVLTNLCDNAIKFTATGSVNVVVEATPWRADGYEVHLSVQDTGIGIPADQQHGVFEAFNQADTSTTRQFGGTGLGLTISARLVELMGGRIWVESEPGQGSTFHFTVHVRGVQVAPCVVSDLAPPPSDEARALQVLLVEDHPINQLLATTLLKKWGHHVVLAKNGQEAVDLFPGAVWDVVLMDMQMPVMGGLDATRLIRASELPSQHTPIIAMTANAMESDRQACLDAGMDVHLAKPFSAAALQAVIQRCVDPEKPVPPPDAG